MGSPIIIEFVSKVTSFLRGTDQTERALSEVSEELKDVGRQGDALERELSDTFDDAARSAKTFGDKADLAMDQVGASGTRAGTDVRDGFREGTGEVGEEAAENISEAFRSGDFAGAGVETATSLTTGLSSVLGPVGALVGIGAGIIGGLVGGMLAEREKITEVGLSLGRSLGEAISTGTSEQDFRGIAVEAIEEMFEGQALTDLYANLELAGSSMNALVEAVMGGPEALAALEEELLGTRDAGTSASDAWRGGGAELTDEAKAAWAAAVSLGGLGDATEGARKYALAHADAIDGTISSSSEARSKLDDLSRSKGKSKDASKGAEGASKGSERATRGEARANEKAAGAADKKARATQRLKEKVRALEQQIDDLPNDKIVNVRVNVNDSELDRLERLVARLP